MGRKPEQETGGANLRIDDETGMPYWELWGEGWKDSVSEEPGKPIEMSPTAFPPGTRIVVIEPDIGSSASQDFYKACGERKEFYPCDYDKYGDP